MEEDWLEYLEGQLSVRQELTDAIAEEATGSGGRASVAVVKRVSEEKGGEQGGGRARRRRKKR